MDKAILKKLKEEKHLLLNTLARIDMENVHDRKIMVVDDCADTLHIVKKFLTNINRISVETFMDEYDAMLKFIKEKPDLIILDMNLNDLNGIKVATIMKNLSTFEVPIIFISSDNWVAEEGSNFSGKNTVFIPKPIQREHLILSVKNILER